MQIARHRSAMVRGELSRPLRLAVADGILAPGRTLTDYGCGRGGDVARLRDAGYDCVGWDPVHADGGERRPSSVVNLGYVVNVIEDAGERAEVLRSAWALARDVLVVSARLVDERPDTGVLPLGDGVVTRLGTFQRFYEQQELRAWIDAVLGGQCVATAPGVFYAFRSVESRAEFLAGRLRRREPLPRLRRSEALAAANMATLEALARFMGERGRLPADDELTGYADAVSALGGMRRAFLLLTTITDQAAWQAVRERRAEDLLVYLALARFEGRPGFASLPVSLQRDVRAFHGSYARACALADDLLLSIGDRERLGAALAASPVGKLLPTALYVHVDALGGLPAPLRLYEGCARAVLGSVDGATIIKLRRDEPKVSYLCYPGFERDGHPALAESVSLHLQTFRIRTRRYEGSRNPPVLHRKEAFVAANHPSRERFARLTRAEERAGLLAETSRIGTRDGWIEALAARGYVVRGHRLMRSLPSAGRA